MSLAIHPLFVFDGPNKPPFKRHKKTGPNVASIPEFLAKQLLKQFGFPFHLAPGEAEAECALLQREGIVDAVLSEDVDTLMFGSGVTLRNWTPEGSKSKTPTHVNVYEADRTKAGSSGLDREGMVLVALMSGGDYIPEGIPGCGPKLACEAARAAFGKDLCQISRKDTTSLKVWRERLQYELRTNESKFFRTKHSALTIPEEFPNPDVLGYYTHPVVSTNEKLERLKKSLSWELDIDFPALREFTAEAFAWTKLGGAKHFIRNLSPALLVHELAIRGQRSDNGGDDPAVTEKDEARLVNSIHGTRNHPSTDNTTELRIAFVPHNLVPIDLDNEEPDDEIPEDDTEADEVEGPIIEDAEAPDAPEKRRAPTKYDPVTIEKIWVLETYARVGVPLKVQDWEASFRDPKKHLAAKHANRAAAKGSKTSKTGGMNRGALNKFAKTMKPGVARPHTTKSPEPETLLSASQPIPKQTTTASTFRMPMDFPSTQITQGQPDILSLLSSSPPRRQAQQTTESAEVLPPTVTKRRRRSPLRRAQTSPASLLTPKASQRQQTDRPATPSVVSELDLTVQQGSPSSYPSPSQAPPKRAKTTRGSKKSTQHPAKSTKTTAENAILLSSSPPRTIDAWIRRSQSAAPQKTSHAASKPAQDASANDTSMETLYTLAKEHGPNLEVRTVHISIGTVASEEAIAQIDLTASSTTRPPRKWPKPGSYSANIEKLSPDVDQEDEDATPRPRRTWNKIPALTETSGNQPTPKAVVGTKAKSKYLLSTQFTAAASRPQLPVRGLEKKFIRLGSVAEGFWDEVSEDIRNSRITSSRRSNGVAVKAKLLQPASASGRNECQIWAWEDLEVVDLTTPQ